MTTDNYTHNETNVIYVVENILGPAQEGLLFEDLESKFNSQITDHCMCNEICDMHNCSCFQKSAGDIYFRHNIEQEISPNWMKQCEYTHPIMECNNLCSCSSRCGNRIVQRGPLVGLYVKKCSVEGKGLGLFTEHPIPKGTFICEYAGEVITKSQALQRHDRNLKQEKMNYIFCLQEYSNGNIFQTFVDPSNFGNIGRYVNHSCEPNCIVTPTRVNTLIPKLAIFSHCDLTPHSEITLNYGPCNNIEDVKLESNKRKICLCDSTTCKRYLPFNVY